MSFKNHIIRALLALAIMPGLWSCSRMNESAQEPVISVSISPLQYFVDQLTGDSIEVNVMVPQGASHGTYSPTARQMQKLSDSDLYLRISSLGYEQAFIHRLRELNSRMKVVDLNEGQELIRGVIHHGDHVHEGGIDPHIWMSPKVMMSVLPIIRDALIEVYPGLRLRIEENYAMLWGDVQSIHLEMEQLTADLAQKSFLIFHPALTYLARDYGMQQIAIEHEGKEPSPAQLMQLVRQSRAQSIPVIFIQQEYDLRNATLVSQETGANIVQIDPMAYDWFHSMQHIAETFRNHLQ